MEFWENLPEQCPPGDASKEELTGLYRLVAIEDPTDEDFKSSRSLGKKRPQGVDECRWASCSLVYDPKQLKKLPKFRSYKWAAKLEIPFASGQGHKTSSNHVDYWWSKSCDISRCITEVVEI